MPSLGGVLVYKEEFVEAVERTRRLGLTLPKYGFSDERFLTPEKLQQLPYAVRDAVGEISLEEVVAKCLSLHYMLLDPLADFFSTSVVYTIGYVSTPHCNLYKMTEDNLRNLLKFGLQSFQLDIHAWVTLPSMEILDFSLATSMAVINDWNDGHGAVVAGHADEFLYGIEYHPMVLGDNILRKIGALVEFKVWGI